MSFRGYDNSDAVATMITTNFHLYLIQLLCQFFQNFVYGKRSLCSNLGGVDPEKLYRATLTTRRAVACCRSAVSAWWLGQPCLHHLHVICTAFPGGLSLRLAFGSFFSFFYPHPSSPFIFPVINQCDMCLVSFAWGLMVGRRGFTRG